MFDNYYHNLIFLKSALTNKNRLIVRIKIDLFCATQQFIYKNISKVHSCGAQPW